MRRETEPVATTEMHLRGHAEAIAQRAEHLADMLERDVDGVFSALFGPGPSGPEDINKPMQSLSLLDELNRIDRALGALAISVKNLAALRARIAPLPFAEGDLPRAVATERPLEPRGYPETAAARPGGIYR